VLAVLKGQTTRFILTTFALLFRSPSIFPFPPCNPEDLEAIEDIVLAHTRLVMDALSVDEMQSECALLSHIDESADA
jgi:hypothetical protein